MSIIKRWTTSIAWSFDQLMNHVENHEALVSGAIREMQEFGAKARVQLKRVQRDSRTMQQRVKELEEVQALWAERALRVMNSDNEKALDCLRRRRRAAAECAALKEQLREHLQVEEQLVADLAVIKERIEELKRKKNELCAREYRTQAAQAGQLTDLGLVREIDEIFNRWEMKVGVCESFVEPPDTLEDSFVAEEERQMLEAELVALVRSSAANAL